MKTEKSTFSITFLAHKGKLVKRTGLAPILGRITVNGQSTHFSTHLGVHPENWSTEEGGKSIGKSQEDKMINARLKDLRAAFTMKYNQQTIIGQPVTPISLKNSILKTTPAKEEKAQLDLTTIMMAEHFQKFNDDYKALVGKGKEHKSWTRYELTLKKLKMFMEEKYGKPNIPLQEITTQYYKDFFIWLRVNEPKCSHNYHMKTVQRVGTVYREAIDNGYITRDAFKHFKVSFEEVDRGFLTMQEIKKLLDKKFDSERLKRVRDLFIFSCFTGLAYCDVCKLKKDEVSTEEDGKLWIKTKRGKNGIKVNLVILDAALKIMKKYPTPDDCDRVFDIPSNQKVNDYLKEIAALCGIDKRITFHLARHTFATTITLLNGVPIETVSKMLGHTNLRTTQIYARVLNEKIGKDMVSLQQKLKQTNLEFAV